MNKTQKPQPTITLHIERGPTTPGRLEAWRRVWVRLIWQVQNGEAPGKEMPPNQAPPNDALIGGDKENYFRE